MSTRARDTRGAPDSRATADDDPIRRLGAPLLTHTGPRGTVDLWRPGTGLLITRVTGHLTTDGAMEMAGLLRRQVAEDGWNMAFNEWSRMEDYDAQARTLLTRATLEVLGSVKGSHFLVRSRVVAFGVQAANIVLRRLTLHPNEASFQRELADALAKRGSVPPGSTPPVSSSPPPASGGRPVR